MQRIVVARQAIEQRLGRARSFFVNDIGRSFELVYNRGRTALSAESAETPQKERLTRVSQSSAISQIAVDCNDKQKTASFVKDIDD